jgi:excisionase family DNA binding protein
MKDEGARPLHEDELLTVAVAAALAGRSMRTIQRAYSAGNLLAYRDGNGRGVRIRYGDLRQWMMATIAATPKRHEEAPPPSHPLKRLDMGGRTPATGPSENLALLNAARAQLRRGVAPAGVAPRRAAGSAVAPRA